jgi:peptidoglycan-binding protein ArfA
MTRAARFLRQAVVAGLCAGLAQPATAQLLLSLPPSAEQTARNAGANEALALPVGPWADGRVASMPLTGAVTHQAWRVPGLGANTLTLMQGLRADLAAAGYLPIFACETDACGGFDFRYGTRVLPEPDMHVDLGDFRFLSAVRGRGAEAEYAALLVSRAGDTGFVQLSLVSAAARTVTAPPAPVPAPPDSPLPDPPMSDPATTEALESQGRAVLEDLTFASGAADLAPGRPASLVALADYLARHPKARVVIVGHTDASGALEANIVLSKRRAQAVADRLLSVLGAAPAQVSAEGVGFLAPRATNLTEDGRHENRRVEAVLASTP